MKSRSQDCSPSFLSRSFSPTAILFGLVLPTLSTSLTFFAFPVFSPTFCLFPSQQAGITGRRRQRPRPTHESLHLLGPHRYSWPYIIHSTLKSKQQPGSLGFGGGASEKIILAGNAPRDPHGPSRLCRLHRINAQPPQLMTRTALGGFCWPACSCHRGPISPFLTFSRFSVCFPLYSSCFLESHSPFHS